VCLAHIVDGNGLKMSKSRGNVVDPWSVLDTRGADALRWYMFSSGSPWTTKRVSVEGVDETTRKFLLTLWNAYSFFVTYANLDDFDPTERPVPPADRPLMDRWLLSALARLVAQSRAALDAYDARSALFSIEAFWDDLSTWYLRRNRARFWKSSDPAAHATLYECLLTIARILAPYCPFVTDELARNLAPEAGSVHLADWPEESAGPEYWMFKGLTDEP